ncbi:MAG: hypothetical protein K0R34_2496 [Herbinix sp.]|jgi:DNA-directed RNA polymerase specialized sigma subunit|nr:hypothetical protein [Herbinix sp.]
MTDKELNQYLKLLREAYDLQTRIDQLFDKELSTSHTVVKGSSKRFPYTETHMGVWIDDLKEVATRDKLIASYRLRLDRAQEEILKIEQYINDIPDSDLRQIFEYRYVDGKKLWEIAELLNMDRSGIGKKINSYINFPPIPQNT